MLRTSSTEFSPSVPFCGGDVIGSLPRDGQADTQKHALSGNYFTVCRNATLWCGNSAKWRQKFPNYVYHVTSNQPLQHCMGCTLYVVRVCRKTTSSRYCVLVFASAEFLTRNDEEYVTRKHSYF